MSALINGELIKLRTTRTALGFAGATALLVLAQVLISILAGDPTNITDKRSALAIGGTVSITLLVFGVVGATGEFRHRTMAPAVLIAPDRIRLAIARVIAYALAAAAFGAASLVVALVIGVPLLGGTEGPDLEGGDYVPIVAGGLGSALLCAALGVGVGLIVRNQVAGVVGALVWLSVVEPLTGLIGDDIVDYTIGTASAVAAGADGDMRWGAAMAVLAAWAAVLIALGLLVDRRRDVE